MDALKKENCHHQIMKILEAKQGENIVMNWVKTPDGYYVLKISCRFKDTNKK